MAYKTNKDNSIKNDYNVLSNTLNHNKHAKNKDISYPPVLKGCMNTRSGREKFRNFRILLYNGHSSTIVMGKPMSKLEQKQSETSTIGNQRWEVQNL